MDREPYYTAVLHTNDGVTAGEIVATLNGKPHETLLRAAERSEGGPAGQQDTFYLRGDQADGLSLYHYDETRPVTLNR